MKPKGMENTTVFTKKMAKSILKTTDYLEKRDKNTNNFFH